MSNELNLPKFYQFLTSFGENNAWIAEADESGDGLVIKREFKNFVLIKGKNTSVIMYLSSISWYSIKWYSFFFSTCKN